MIEGCAHGPTFITGGPEKCPECKADAERGKAAIVEAAAKLKELKQAMAEQTPAPTAELLPCPFCGNPEPEIECTGTVYYVHCEDCDAYGPTVGAEDGLRSTPIAAWNRRAVPAPEPPAVGLPQTDLEELLQRFAAWLEYARWITGNVEHERLQSCIKQFLGTLSPEVVSTPVPLRDITDQEFVDLTVQEVRHRVKTLAATPPAPSSATCANEKAAEEWHRLNGELATARQAITNSVAALDEVTKDYKEVYLEHDALVTEIKRIADPYRSTLPKGVQTELLNLVSRRVIEADIVKDLVAARQEQERLQGQLEQLQHRVATRGGFAQIDDNTTKAVLYGALEGRYERLVEGMRGLVPDLGRIKGIINNLREAAYEAPVSQAALLSVEGMVQHLGERVLALLPVASGGEGKQRVYGDERICGDRSEQ